MHACEHLELWQWACVMIVQMLDVLVSYMHCLLIMCCWLPVALSGLYSKCQTSPSTFQWVSICVCILFNKSVEYSWSTEQFELKKWVVTKRRTKKEKQHGMDYIHGVTMTVCSTSLTAGRPTTRKVWIREQHPCFYMVALHVLYKRTWIPCMASND